MIYEYRRYECMPGKLQALEDLMKDLAVPIFNRLGMKLIGSWTPLAGDVEATVIYILAFKTVEERNEKWKAFYADSEWKDKRAVFAQKAGGPIVARSSNVFLTPSAYSPLQ